MTDLENAMKHCRDYGDYPQIFSENYGVGITFKDDAGVEYTTVVRDKQILKVDTLTFGGTGNYHYYGKIRVAPPALKFTTENGTEKTMRLGGSFDKLKPLECKGVEIELIRTITQEEIDENPDRWCGYNVLSTTNAFRTLNELLLAIELVHQERFPEWEMKMNI
jgi:hypothetical protein